MNKRNTQPAARFSLPQLLWLPIVFVAGVVAANVSYPRPSPSTSADERVLMATVEALTDRLDDLDRRLQMLAAAPRTVVATRSPPAPAAAPAAPPSPTPAEDDTDAETRVTPYIEPAEPDPSEQAVVQATADALDTQLDDEPIDEAWAADQEQQIQQDTGAGALGAGYLVDAHCRASLCRVQIEHPSAAELDRVMLTLMSKPGFAGRRLFTQQATDTSGSGRMTIYVARTGRPLPTDSLSRSLD